MPGASKSKSTTRTRFPALATRVANAASAVVRPTPPLNEKKEMMGGVFGLSGQGGSKGEPNQASLERCRSRM